MSFRLIHNALRAHLLANLPTGVTSAQVTWDNAEGAQPESAVWLRAAVRPGESFQTTFGSLRWRTPGALLISVFAPIDKGDKAALTAADEIADAFRGVVVGDVDQSVLCRMPSVQTVGREAKWHRVNVTVPWQADSDGALVADLLNAAGPYTANGDILPGEDAEHELGSALLRWLRLWVDHLVARQSILLDTSATLGWADVVLTRFAAASLQLAGALLPDGDLTRDLGAGGKRWSNAYAGTVYAGTVYADVSAALVSASSGVLLPDGSVGVPGARFAGGEGLYRIGAGNIAFAVGGGAKALDLSTTRVLSTLPLQVPAGTVGAPAIAFSDDADGTGTGLYRIAANNIGLALNGTNAVDFSTSRILSAVRLQVPVGSAAAPSIAGPNAGGWNQTGLWWDFGGGNPFLNVAVNGVDKASFGPTGLFLTSTYQLGIGDAILSRAAANVLQLAAGDALRLDVGSASAPVLHAIGATTTGLFFTTDPLVGVAVGAAEVARFVSAGLNLASGKALQVAGSQVVGARKTGWTAATGTADRTSFDTATVTTEQLAQRVKALIDDLHATAGHGLIGA